MDIKKVIFVFLSCLLFSLQSYSQGKTVVLPQIESKSEEATLVKSGQTKWKAEPCYVYSTRYFQLS
ncbi:hypothetical protein [Dysgonomonas sp. 520]|uniref:hypothetical protein n=1 Tax=Dysgonomonas sp. 520 TaxID=2302931 RepID=UPI0013D0AC1E|nr:hypothetical protein [Dysgonomonas sp. 520]NDW08678.1 hypothetical protein [Dysgonomonas sp. 520]